MTRVLIQSLLLFLLPFVLYALWLVLTRRGAGLLRSTPWFMLSTAGLVLAVAGLVVLVISGGMSPEGVYVPPHRDPSGRIVPGAVRPSVLGS